MSSSTSTSEKLSLPIHQILHSFHLSSGYHHFTTSSSTSSSSSSPTNYLSYLSNKLSKLRKSLNSPASTNPTANPIAANNKSSNAQNSAGNTNTNNGKTYIPQPITLLQCSTNSKYFTILLILIEKYYTKSLISKNNYHSTKKSKLLAQEIKNKQKALKYCEILMNYCIEICDEQAIFESKALFYWFTSSIHFISENWQICYENSLKSLTIYEELCRRGRQGDRTMAMTMSLNNNDEIFQQYIDNLKPTLRFCCYNLGIKDYQDAATTTSSSLNDNESIMKLFSNDLEMLNKLEVIRLKSLSNQKNPQLTSDESDVNGSVDPIYQLFNSIVWCNHQILLPYHVNTTIGSSGPHLSPQDQAFITSLHNNCGKLISFLELQSNLQQQQQQQQQQPEKSLNSSKSGSNANKNSSSINSLYLQFNASLTVQSITHYLSLINDITSIITRLINTLPSSILSSSAAASSSSLQVNNSRLTRDSLTYLRQYFNYLQYYAQYQQSVMLLNQIRRHEVASQQPPEMEKGKEASLENINLTKLHQSQEKCHICDQIMRNISEMTKLIEGTRNTTLPIVSNLIIQTEESQEDILLLFYRLLTSIYRIYRLIYLAESYGYYGLVINSSPSPSPGNGTGENGEEELKENEMRDSLKSNLEKAYGLLEYADGIMSGDVYNYFDDYSASINSSNSSSSTSYSSSSSIETCQSHLKTLEDLISGGKTRLLAYSSLATLSNPSSDSSLLSILSSNSSSATSTSTGHHHTSLVRYPNQWIPLVEKKTEQQQSQQQQQQQSQPTKGHKNKSKGTKLPIKSSSAPSKTLIVQPIPPLFEPIPCKPIVYDIALSKLETKVNNALDVRCGIKKLTKTSSLKQNQEEGQSSPSPSSIGGASSGGLVSAAASWLGWFGGGGGASSK